jgi:hypothetical protein
MASLHVGVVLAGVWTIVALTFLLLKVRRYGKRTLYARAAGDPAKGVIYAFTKAMAPQAKESVRMNPVSYAAGMTFHVGAFTAFALLIVAMTSLRLPAVLLSLARVFTLAGAMAGFGLLTKRLVQPQLRGLSCLDDYLSNLLTSTFAALACASTFSLAFESVWMGETIVLLLYVPLGKIRHCCFFFTTRYHMGAFFGRRGTFPPEKSVHA